jgi:hypothetical protein
MSSQIVALGTLASRTGRARLADPCPRGTE